MCLHKRVTFDITVSPSPRPLSAWHLMMLKLSSNHDDDGNDDDTDDDDYDDDNDDDDDDDVPVQRPSVAPGTKLHSAA